MLTPKSAQLLFQLIEALLTRKGLDDVAFGRAPKPLTGPNSKGVKDWERKNKEARAEIMLHVEEDQLTHCFSMVASETLDELERVHRAHGLATRLAYRRRFLTMKKKADQSMSAWVAEVRTLAQRLRGLGVSVDDEDIILALTMGLPRTYDMFVVTLDATAADDLNLHIVISRLLNEESRHAAVATAEEMERDEEAAVAAALKPATSKLERITCFNCGNKGHFQANCPHPRDNALKGSTTPAAALAAPKVPMAASAVVTMPKPGARIARVIEEEW